MVSHAWIAMGQRERKRHPAGISVASGTSPLSSVRVRGPDPNRGAIATSACV